MASKMVFYNKKKEYKVVKLYSWMSWYKEILGISIVIWPLLIITTPYILFSRYVIYDRRKVVFKYLKAGYRIDETDYNAVIIYTQKLGIPLLPFDLKKDN